MRRDANTEAPRGASLAVVASLVLLTLALRWVTFGNPLLEVDEQFYLLVGERMLGGALPFVDLWDRKPFGLFALYAGFAAIGDGVLGYQIAAAVSVVLTALVIYRIGRKVAGPAGSWMAALSYPLYLSAFHSFGGQTPVFYNLLVAASALIVARQVEEPGRGGLVSQGTLAMLLMGIALQIKYSVVFEGIALGLVLMALARREGHSWPATLVLGSVWAGTALLPTLAVTIYYAALGHLDVLVSSNVTSNFGRQFLWRDWMIGAAKSMASLGGYWLAIGAGLWWARRQSSARRFDVTTFLRIWGLAALVGFFALGTYFDHYRTPLLAPLAVLSAPALGLRGLGLALSAALLAPGAWLAVTRTARQEAERGHREQALAAARLLKPYLANGCLYLYEGDAALYRLTGSCLPTRFPFPPHLSQGADVMLLGADPVAEIGRIMDRRPGAVVLLEGSPGVPATLAALHDRLAADYQPVARFPIGRFRYRVYAPAP